MCEHGTDRRCHCGHEAGVVAKFVHGLHEARDNSGVTVENGTLLDLDGAL